MVLMLAIFLCRKVAAYWFLLVATSLVLNLHFLFLCMIQITALSHDDNDLVDFVT